MVERNITVGELLTAGSLAEIIEDYPSDKICPSCLLLGFTDSNRPLHFLVSRIQGVQITVVTIYEPQSNDWEDFRRRR
jgi:hypothetical protein